MFRPSCITLHPSQRQSVGCWSIRSVFNSWELLPDRALSSSGIQNGLRDFIQRFTRKLYSAPSVIDPSRPLVGLDPQQPRMFAPHWPALVVELASPRYRLPVLQRSFRLTVAAVCLSFLSLLRSLAFSTATQVYCLGVPEHRINRCLRP